QSVEYAYAGSTIRPRAPSASQACASFTASPVDSEPMPGITGTSPSAFTRVRTTATFSSNDSVALSPSEPSGTTPMQPASTCHCACLARKAWSTWPSSVKGVVIAGITPCHMLLLISHLLGLARWKGVAESGEDLQRNGKDRGTESAPGGAAQLGQRAAAHPPL